MLEYFSEYLIKFEHIVIHSSIEDFDISNDKILIEMLEKMLDKANLKIETLLIETKHEIDKHIITNSTASYHSTITIILLTILITIFGTFQVFKLVKRLTTPLNELVNSTKIISSGNFTVKTNITTNDELQILGNSFNNMIETLDKTTISVNFFNDILHSMYESLIVTDNEGIIKLVNDATTKMLNYSSKQLLGNPISLILYEQDKRPMDFDFNKLHKKGSISNVEKNYLTNKGEFIPVLFSCSTLKNSEQQPTGIVFVAHDIRERKQIYNELNRIRKKHFIDINEAQEKERLRIANDIHDGLGHILTGISYYVENNLMYNKISESELLEHSKVLQNMLSKGIKESKNIAFDLIPILLKDFGLVVAIENLFENLNAQKSTQFGFKTYNFNSRIDEKLEKVLYRIIQEATSNIIKHSGASSAIIQLIGHDKTVSLIVNDEGKGFDYESKIKETKNRGIGLISMKERVESNNGIFSINTEIGVGTEILIEIPLN